MRKRIDYLTLLLDLNYIFLFRWYKDKIICCFDLITLNYDIYTYYLIEAINL